MTGSRTTHCTAYTTARRVDTVNFPPGGVCCNNCNFCRHKSGLTKGMERYENHVCVLTYEPLARKDICRKTGEYCPLEFDFENEDNEENKEESQNG